MTSTWKTFIVYYSDCRNVDFKLNPDKFTFMLDDVEYLGTTISAAGISPTAGKVQAIKDAAPPTSVSELQSFLGSANFLPKFVPDFAMIASPLYSLLRKETPWKWATPEQDAFDNIKAALCSDSVLRHYDPTVELVLQCDASSVGVGAAWLQPAPDGTFSPTSLRPYSLTALRPYSLTALHPYSLTALQPYILTALRPYILTAFQPYILTALQPYSLTSLRPYSLTSLHPYGLTALRPYILTALHPYILTAFHPYILISLRPFSLTSLRLTALHPYGLTALYPYGLTA